MNNKAHAPGMTELTAEDEAIFASFKGATWASFEEFSYHSDTTDANNARENVRSATAAKWYYEAEEAREWRESCEANRRAEGAWEDAGCRS